MIPVILITKNSFKVNADGIKIILEYIDENEKTIKKEIDGYEARILQHEIDHLSGKLFVDYSSSLKRNIIIKKVKKLKNS